MNLQLDEIINVATIKFDTKNVLVFMTDLNGNHMKYIGKKAITLGTHAGKPEGIQGFTYAVPVYDNEHYLLPSEEIYEHVEKFVAIAKKYKSTNFYVLLYNNDRVINDLLKAFFPVNIIPNIKAVKLTRPSKGVSHV